MFYQSLSNVDILTNLKRLNTDLHRMGVKANIIIVGGSAMSLLGADRGTKDIDYLGKLPFNSQYLSELQMSNDVERIFVIPDISEVKFDLHYPFSNLDVKVMSWEDLAIMKFYTTRQKDYDDLLDFILPKIESFSRLYSRLQYYKADYIFNLNDSDLNLNQFENLLSSLKVKHKIIVCNPRVSLESVLKKHRLYSKFMRSSTINLDKGKALKCTIGECLSVFGFRELLQKSTKYDFRV